MRFSSISFLKIVLHFFAQNNDLVRIFRSIFSPWWINLEPSPDCHFSRCHSMPWTVTTTLLPNIFGSHVKKAGPSASGTQQQFYEVGDKLMDSHCFLLFFAISSNLLKKLCQFCAAGAKSSAFSFIYSSYNCKTRPVLVPHIVCKAGYF